MTLYEDIYKLALARIEDHKLALLPDEDLENTLHGWLVNSLVKMHRSTSESLERDDDNKAFVHDLSDLDIQILSIYMTNEWLSPQINSITLTKQIIGGAEEKFYAQSNHLSELRKLKEDNIIDAKKLYRDYTFGPNSSYFKD